jgi:hypothetical protein
MTGPQMRAALLEELSRHVFLGFSAPDHRPHCLCRWEGDGVDAHPRHLAEVLEPVAQAIAARYFDDEFRALIDAYLHSRGPDTKLPGWVPQTSLTGPA